MDPKNRFLIALLVIILIVGAMFTSFGRNLFSFKTPKIELPQAQSSNPQSSSSDNSNEQYLRVEVTPSTVQSIIQTLNRSDSYFRELTVESFWGENSATTQVEVWSDDGWTLVRQTMPSGVIRHDLIGPTKAYCWYDNSRDYLTLPVDQLTADLAQRMPTYETVLALDPASITRAGYENRGGIPCVFVEAKDKQLGYLFRYWVNIQSGLLISAETEKASQIVYRMTAYSSIQSPCPVDASFALPDGTVCHLP